MRFSSHLRLLAIGVGVWAAFWVLGLPDYYQQYSFTFVAIATAALVPPSVWIGWRVIGSTKPQYRAARGFWLAVYFSAPFVLLDALYCGLYLGHGLRFFSKYWYLTAFYFVPWLYVPMGFIAARKPG